MKRSPGISVGAPSIVAVFVILCIFVFSALSLISANSDLSLARRTGDACTSYYAADALAEESLALVAAADDKSDLAAAGYETETRDGRLIALREFEINERRLLYVELDCGPADAPDFASFTRLAWQARPAGEYQIDDGLNLFS